MAWRGLHISQSARLSLANRQLSVTQETGEVRLPFEDLAWIILDTPQATLTSAALSACASAGIAVILTDATHTPSGVVLPFHAHHRQAEIARHQIAARAPLQKRLWQRLIQAKISNQAKALEIVGASGASPLHEMSRQVRSGDPNNLEARAARAYWNAFWKDFRRNNDGDLRNQLLNYGYAIVRSAMARALVATGLLPAIGIHHASITNPFNLADDMVEPFRPFVDILAWRTAQNKTSASTELTLNDRRTMAGILLESASLGAETVTMLQATERTAASLARAMETDSVTHLLVPDIPQ
ncbi:MAG: type II CRISPR-associated endonuclease Cas1 [Rhodospirillaceae bacterium]|nr:type II CRISPR-associated endonuclease Cas1 [Rhodospirillaceae bacterium]